MKTLPHGPIEKLDDGVWRVQGTLPRGPLKRVMTILKLASGPLVIHSGVALSDEELAEVDAFGKVEFIIAPNGYHRLDLRDYADRYPDAKVLCPPAVRTRIEQVARVTGGYDLFPKDDAVSIEMLDGTGEREAALIHRGKNGATLVLNDAVFNHPHETGFMGFVMNHVMGSTGGPKVTPLGKMLLVKDKAAFKAHLLRLAGTPDLKRIIVSHYEVIDRELAKTLRDVAEAYR